jgi:hypothetical protein
MPLTCSARGCQNDAVWVLLWNNPKLHTPDRRKSWLACDEHRTTLGEFLTARGFLKDTVTVEQHQREQPGERPDELPRKPTPGDPLG